MSMIKIESFFYLKLISLLSTLLTIPSRIIFLLKFFQSSMRSQKSLQILRRVHTSTQNGQKNLSPLTKLRRVRLNSLQNEQQLPHLKMTRSNTTSIKFPLQFNNSPTKYYESKLILSCQSWSAYNLSQKKYKRGWRPIKMVNLTGFLKLILLELYYSLQQEFPWINHISIRANRYLLKKQLQKKSKPLVQQYKLQSLESKLLCPYLLAENTIIPLKDLIVGNFYTEYEDLSQYSVIFMGALLRDIKKGQKRQHKCYIVEEEQKHKGKHLEKNALVSLFIAHANSWLKNMEYSSSSINQNCQFYSSPEQLTRIFAGMLQRRSEFERLLSQHQIQSTIKYQMGYRFYEQRKLKFAHDWPSIFGQWVVKTKNQFNFAVLSYNKQTQNVIALYDCKYSMEDIDLKRIEDFLQILAKPIVQKKEKQSLVSKLPILRLSE